MSQCQRTTGRYLSTLHQQRNICCFLQFAGHGLDKPLFPLIVFIGLIGNALSFLVSLRQKDHVVESPVNKTILIANILTLVLPVSDMSGVPCKKTPSSLAPLPYMVMIWYFSMGR